MKEKSARVTRAFNDFLKHTNGKCPIIAYFDPIVPAVKCAIEHNLVSGISYWVVYKGKELASNFWGYETGARDSEARKKSLGPGGVPYTPGAGWDEVERPAAAEPLDGPVKYVSDLPQKSIDLIKQAGLFFYTYLAFDDGRIDPEVYLDTFGEKWIPGLLSEEDHSLYVNLAKHHARNPIKDRDEAYRLAREYMKWFYEEKRPYGLSGSAVAWFQAASMTGQQRWDHELATANFQVMAGFLRGVSRQNNIPFIIYAAPWAYGPDNIWGMRAEPQTPFAKVLNCPAYVAGGKPPHLLERLWYFCWFSGPAALVLESTQIQLFKQGADKDTFEPGLTAPIMKRLNHLAFDSEFDRGTPYRPACVLLDERHGWTVPSTPDAVFDNPQRERRKVWGVFDGTHQDIMIDNFFGAIYPGYERANEMGARRGSLAVTPYGESFDVLLSNAPAAALSEYPVTFVVGRPVADDDFRERLDAYAGGGGHVILNIEQVTFEWQDMLGVRFDPRHNRYYTALGAQRVSDYSEWLNPRMLWEEPRYRYARLQAGKDAEVLALTEQGDPLVVRTRRGKGWVTLVTAQWMQELDGTQWPGGLLNVAKHVIGDALAPHQKIRVRGPLLQYMVNTTEQGLSVLLINNSDALWHGWVTFPGMEQALVKEWYAGDSLRRHAANGALSVRLDIPSYSLRLLSVTAE